MTETGLIVPVPQAEPAVGRHRAALDRAAAWGIPAHITVLYPFLPPGEIDDAVLAQLRGLLGSVPSFEATLTRVGWFGDEVVWLAPEPAQSFRDLTQAVWDRFPTVPPYGGAFADVVPHLTVGEGAPRARLDAAAADVASHLPIRASVTRVWMVEGATGEVPWRTVAEFPLAG